MPAVSSRASRQRFHLTLVYQIDGHCKRLLWIGEQRTVKTLLRFFHWFGKERNQALRFVCSDMWKPYLKVIAKKASGALHILDRFHIMAHLSKAIDEVRAQEVKELKAKGYEPVLTKTRWLLLKRPENLTEKQDTKLADLLQYNLRSIRSYLLKEEFQLFWQYTSPYWAGEFFDKWCTKTLRALKHDEQTLGYAGRSPSASPACGYAQLRKAQQQALVDLALAEHPVDDPGERLEDTDTHFSDY